MPKVHWVIPCPICGKRLRLLNQSMLGRRGQCPSCRHKFTLELPKAPDFSTKHEEAIAAAGESPEETLKYDYDLELSADDSDVPEA